MTTFVHSFCSRHVLCLDHKEYENIRELKTYLHETKGVPFESCFLVCNGSLVDDDEPVQENVVYHTYVRLVGGKGGFGSMLRAIGAQIEKTTNHEACRDLSGRRMRDVNTEKDLKDWLAKKAERDKEKEERREARKARRRAIPQHKFEDPLYEKQRELISQNQDDALQKGTKLRHMERNSVSTGVRKLGKHGLKKVTGGASASTASSSGKRKAETCTSDKSIKKKNTEWLGVDMDMSDIDSEGDSSDSSDSQGPPVHVKLEPGTSDTSSNDSSGPSTSSAAACTSKMSDEIRQLEVKTEKLSDTESSGVETKDGDKLEDVNQSDIKIGEDVKVPEGQSGVIEPKNEVHKETVSEEIKGQTENIKAEGMDRETGSDAVLKQFNLDDMKSLEEVQSYGLEVLKAELMSRGLKCGGTLEQRAERLFSVKGLATDQIDSSLFAKSNGKNVKKKK